jgi:hypothetical protein
VGARLLCLIAGIERATEPVVTIRRSPRLTTIDRVAHLQPVAKHGVIAFGVTRYVVTTAVRLVTRVESTIHIVVAVGRRAGPAPANRVTELHPITGSLVAAGDVVRNVLTRVCRLVTGIDCAGDSVVAVGRKTGLTASDRVADLVAIAQLPVVAVGVVVATAAVIRLVASQALCGARIPV